MTTSIMPEPRQRYFNNDGTPADGCLLYTYAAGTSTPKATYTDAAGTIAHANPIVLSAKGEAVIYWSGNYKVDLKTAGGLQITGYPVDNFQSFDAQVAAADTALRAELAASSGTTLLGWIQAGAGAIARLVQAKLREWVTLKDFALGDGTTNDGAAARAAAASFSAFGGELRIGLATYKLDASSGTVIPITKPVSISGDGGVYTALNPSLAASTDNTIAITPSPSFDYTGLRLSGFALHDPATGLRSGNIGIFADTQVAAANLAMFTLRDVQIGQGSSAAGYAFHHINSAANNVNGGLYTGLFEHNVVKGGIKLDSSGDSISILHNTLSGSRLGVHASLVAGASLLEIQANNITAAWGSIKIDAGSRYRIIGNNCEHNTVGSVTNNNSAVCDIAGANGVMYGGVIKENLFSRFGASDAATLIRLRNSKGTLIEDNVLLSDNAGTLGIDIGADCTDVRIGANTYSSAMATKITDNGVGTMGVVKTATLLNSWVAYAAGTSTLQFMKSSDGMVHVWGSVKDGTTTAAILVATLPVGFRPAEIIRNAAFAYDGVTPSIAQVTLETDGNLRFNYSKTTETSVNFSFPAANLANGTSLE